MDEIYRNSVATIYTYIYVDDTLEDADGAVNISIYNDDTGEEIVASALASGGSGGGDTGIYYYTVGNTITANCGVYRAEWSYEKNGNQITTNNYFSIIVPYATLNELVGAFPHLSTLTFDEFRAVERKVRMDINAYTHQSFTPLGSKAYRIYGTGSNHLSLPDRIYELEYVAHEDPRVVLYDTYTVAGKIQARDDKGALADPAEDYATGPVETVTWDEENPWVIRRRLSTVYPYTAKEDVSPDVLNQKKLFMDKHVYLVRAKVGWERVPPNVNQAAKLLMEHRLSPEGAYNEKGIDVVRAADYRLEFTENPYETTGHIMADRLLADYINVGWHLF